MPSHPARTAWRSPTPVPGRLPQQAQRPSGAVCAHVPSCHQSLPSAGDLRRGHGTSERWKEHWPRHLLWLFTLLLPAWPWVALRRASVQRGEQLLAYTLTGLVETKSKAGGESASSPLWLSSPSQGGRPSRGPTGGRVGSHTLRSPPQIFASRLTVLLSPSHGVNRGSQLTSETGFREEISG